ncbi:high frequency lysogenization protein HflD [Serratia microhaemolytica]|uniref:high frequency lysogenization protein HflD n=1 Tax=Serratia microhaemolytica TaxID=2675110 RepID=UPI000FDDA625|nr:high frequency lysogenization protein HflD [Serratia microhaemolytica]
MAKNYYDITLALAGISQSARLVQQLAHEGQTDQTAFLCMLNSLLQINPNSTLEVFGGELSQLQIGLESLLTMLYGGGKGAGAELTRYSLGIMMLESKLKANQPVMAQLAERLKQLERQLSHFELASDTIINALASIYVDVISPLGPRLQVTGSATMLQNPLVQAKVRATLLAGIRAAVLWKQVGGRRLQFIFSRNRLIKQAKDLIAHCESC